MASAFKIDLIYANTSTTSEVMASRTWLLKTDEICVDFCVCL